MLNIEINKFPRTPHLEGSRLQPGDTTDGQMSFAELADRYPDCVFVNEEKGDGANSAVSFGSDLELLLQSRGHYLNGGAKEAQFSVFKEWARAKEAEMLEVLEDRYTCYGEWMAARHTQFYDNLPHLFLEFDVLDKKTGKFLSTRARRNLLEGSPFTSIHVISEGGPLTRKAFETLIGKSVYRTERWRENLAVAAERAGLDVELTLAQTGVDDRIEGIYLKVERDDEVVARFKYVRAGFNQMIEESNTHWSQRPMIRNLLAPGVNIFGSDQ
jgi:hypothetical protein